jgi:DEAD/DEAH box helicase domain-containing protein
MAQGLGAPPDMVGKIDGSVDVQQRDEILGKSRVVLATPDVCQAWLMSRLSVPTVRNFVAALELIVLDEAHTMEGVFGSNFSFLIRRLLAARLLARGQGAQVDAPRFIAATATISNPAAQMKSLTGYDCDVFDEAVDGSPQSERLCAHVIAPAGEEMSVARALHVDLLGGSGSGAFITFVDSRKGVEALARASEAALKGVIGEGGVMPYRAGYDAMDRERIEQRLREGSLRGVVTTSALELGIDLPSLTVGINIGVPSNRKAYRQRLGRIGRVGPGAFVVVAEATAFTSFGTTFHEYHEMSVEDSYLYLDNRFMQYAHARCVVDEVEALGASTNLPAGVNWPPGFREVFAMARPGGARPPEFDAIAQLGGDSPQRSYPLRNVGEVSFKIAQGDGSDAIGDVTQSQALRECYPGASYLHLGRTYEVVTWITNSFGPPVIKVKPGSPRRSTKPRITTWINAGLAPADLIEGHYLLSDSGFLAECQMQVTEKIEGYTESPPGEYRAYRDLRQRNPNLRSKQRNFRTSGVLVAITEDWIRQKGLKELISSKLASVLAREYSIGIQDIGFAATNISVRTHEGGGPRGDCIAIFDQTYGSLRLTERLFLNFGVLLERLRTGWVADKQVAQQLDSALAFQSWFSRLAQTRVDAQPMSGGIDLSRFVRLLSPGSQACLREVGQLATEVEIIGATVMNGDLMYQVKAAPRYPSGAPVKRWVAVRSVEPSADSTEWQYSNWDTELQEYLGEDSDLASHE